MVALENNVMLTDNLTESIVIVSIRNNIGNNKKVIILTEAVRIIDDLLTNGIKDGFMEEETKRHSNVYKGHPVDSEIFFVFIYEVEKNVKRIAFSEDTNEFSTYTVVYLFGGTLYWCDIYPLEF